MKKSNIELWLQKEYSYPMAFGFIPNMTKYIYEDSFERDFVIVVPGGGYELVSPTEGEIVAKEFYNKGYNVGVLAYTTDFLQTTALEKQPLKDISRAVRYVRANYKNSKVILCGFSAGGHLCGSLAVHYDDILDDNIEYNRMSNRPDACIFSYPVITSGKYAHQGSFRNLIGIDAYENEEHQKKLDYFSLEKHVNDKTPPCFLWHTATDKAVPVENSFMFAQSLMKYNVKFGLHIYSKGEHGLSLSNAKWESGDFGEPYTLSQSFNIIEAIKSDKITIDSSKKEKIIQKFHDIEREGDEKKRTACKEVSSWINLAFDWLDEIL